MFWGVVVWLFFLCIEGVSSSASSAPYYCPNSFYSGWYWCCETGVWGEEPVTCLCELSSEKLESEPRHDISSDEWDFFSRCFSSLPLGCLALRFCWLVSSMVHQSSAFSFFLHVKTLPWHMTLSQTGLCNSFSLLNSFKEMCIPSSKRTVYTQAGRFLQI